MKKSISGIRGIVGKDFSLKDVLQFCNNFSALIKSKKCVIANDTRSTGQMIKETAKAALMQNGIDLFDLGISPTPVAFRESRKYGSGLIITSSHNPLEWNGLKFIIDGRGVNENELGVILNNQKTKTEKFGSDTKATSTYIEDAVKIIGNVDTPPNVTIDVGGGAARDFAPRLLETIGCNAKTINKDIQKTTRGPDPTTEDLEDLISATPKDGIGFAFDLDGDRLVVVKDGKKQTPDVTLGLGVAKALELGYKKFVFSIDTSVSVEKFVKEQGGYVQRCKVGEANVIDLMIKSESKAGGEGSSGGFILPEFNYCRDGILTSGLIASMLTTKEFEEILSFMESYHQIREKISIPIEYHDKIIDILKEQSGNKFSQVITLDGVKGIIDEYSWVLVRKSNTEDIIRISSESNNLQKAKKINADALGLVKEYYERIK